MDYNIQNGGLVLKVDDGFVISDMKDYITRFKSVTDGMFWFMNTDGVYVFYSDQRRKNHICRMRLDNLLCNEISQTPCYGMVLHDDWLFYINENDRKIYSCMKDGKKVIKIVDDYVNNFIIQNGRIFYSTPHGIIVCNDTGKGRDNLNDAAGTMLLLIDNILAYIDKKDQYCIKIFDMESNTTKKVEGIHTSSINSDGRYLYCINRSYGKSIYRIDPKQCTSIRIYGESSEYLHIIDDMLYFSISLKWHKMPLTGGQAILMR